jgi:hypothetical protein
MLGKAVARNVPDTARQTSGGSTFPIGPNPSKSFCRAGTRRVFPGSIPSCSENFGRTRRSPFLPAEGESISCDSPFSAASSGSGRPGATQVWCDQNAVREESRTLKFYRMRGEFTRRFSGSDSAISSVISVAYSVFFEAQFRYSGRADEAVAAKLSCVNHVEYRRTLRTRFRGGLRR